MPDAPKDSAAFLAAYVDASGKAPTPKPKAFGLGSLGAGVTAYLGSSSFHGMASSTKERWRTRCDDIRLRYGIANLESLTARHIKKDLSTFEGHSRNNRLKVWRSLCSFWDEQGMIEINVARQVSLSKTAATDGHTPWTRNDFAAFRAFWAIGTKERLAFELMYRTCAAIGDTCNLTRGNVKDGWLSYTRQKSNSVAACPFYADGPDWFEGTTDLQACLNAEDNHITFLTTQTGKSRSPKSAASWFSKAANAAGLEKGKTAHGIRKGRAAMFKENGASADQRMAILGHETIGEATRYSKSADLRRTVEGTEKFQLSEQVPTQEHNHLKSKG
ncbi:tyrosine-type recombinase/integrase [Pelagimonas varians]|nr:tyrosine-type recombinase/integrase [Pelagimonas varians]